MAEAKCITPWSFHIWVIWLQVKWLPLSVWTVRGHSTIENTCSRTTRIGEVWSAHFIPIPQKNLEKQSTTTRLYSKPVALHAGLIGLTKSIPLISRGLNWITDFSSPAFSTFVPHCHSSQEATQCPIFPVRVGQYTLAWAHLLPWRE